MRANAAGYLVRLRNVVNQKGSGCAGKGFRRKKLRRLLKHYVFNLKTFDRKVLGKLSEKLFASVKGYFS